jgi:hypothetical protein
MLFYYTIAYSGNKLVVFWPPRTLLYCYAHNRDALTQDQNLFIDINWTGDVRYEVRKRSGQENYFRKNSPSWNLNLGGKNKTK